MRRGLKACGGAGSRQLWPLSGPVCCPPTTPPPPGPKGCWAGLGPCPAPCWCCLWFAGTAVLLVRSSLSSALVSPPRVWEGGGGRRRSPSWPWGGRAPVGGSPASGGMSCPPTHWALPADTALPKQSVAPWMPLFCPPPAADLGR